MIHGIRCTWDVHLDWVVFQLNVANASNSMSRRVIFQKLYATGGDIIQLIPFVRAFYAFEYLVFYSHCNRENDITIIPSTMGTGQSDPKGRALFPLVYFHLL
jgi:hypothetical protein